MSLGADFRAGTGMFGQQIDEKNRKTWSWDTCQTNKFRETSQRKGKLFLLQMRHRMSMLIKPLETRRHVYNMTKKNVSTVHHNYIINLFVVILICVVIEQLDSTQFELHQSYIEPI